MAHSLAAPGAVSAAPGKTSSHDRLCSVRLPDLPGSARPASNDSIMTTLISGLPFRGKVRSPYLCLVPALALPGLRGTSPCSSNLTGFQHGVVVQRSMFLVSRGGEMVSKSNAFLYDFAYHLHGMYCCSLPDPTHPLRASKICTCRQIL